jgi:hypothetical protein
MGSRRWYPEIFPFTVNLRFLASFIHPYSITIFEYVTNKQFVEIYSLGYIAT